MFADPNQRRHILVFTDQSVLAQQLNQALTRGAFVPHEARDAAEATRIFEEWDPQVAVVDLDSGGGNVLPRFGQAMQATRCQTPILALTRRGDLKSKLAAFGQGVDDVMTIPLSPDEFSARVNVIVRRGNRGTVPVNTVLKLGPIEIDLMNRQARLGTIELHLTGLEQSLLYLLAAKAGQIVTRDEIADVLWGVDFAAESNVIERHIRGLRHKLRDDWQKPRFIATVPGQGYRFVPISSDGGNAARLTA